MESSLNSITLPQSSRSGDRGDVAVSVQIRIYRLKIVAGDDTSVVKLVQYAIYRARPISSPISIRRLYKSSALSDGCPAPEELPGFSSEEALLQASFL